MLELDGGFVFIVDKIMRKLGKRKFIYIIEVRGTRNSRHMVIESPIRSLFDKVESSPFKDSGACQHR